MNAEPEWIALCWQIHRASSPVTTVHYCLKRAFVHAGRLLDSATDDVRHGEMASIVYWLFEALYRKKLDAPCPYPPDAVRIAIFTAYALDYYTFGENSNGWDIWARQAIDMALRYSGDRLTTELRAILESYGR